MRRTGGTVRGGAGVVAALALLAAGCGGSAATSGAPTTTTTARTPRPTDGGTGGDVVQGDPHRTGRRPDRRLVPRARRLRRRVGGRADVPARLRQGGRPRARRAVPLTPGRLPTCRAPAQPSAPPRPNLNQVALLQRVGVADAGDHSGRPGHHRHRLHGPDLLHDDRRRGQLVRVRRHGLVGQPGRLGRGQPDLVRVARPSASPPRAGPRCGTGSTWTQPSDADTQAQLNSVSCASASFCVLVDSSGGVLDLERPRLLGAGRHRHRAAPRPVPTPPG